jgi:hypothetical protein
MPTIHEQAVRAIDEAIGGTWRQDWKTAPRHEAAGGCSQNL